MVVIGALWYDPIMTELFIAILCFILTHAIPAHKPLRAQLVRAMGQKMYIALYSMMSTAVLIWLGFAYVAAPYVEVWNLGEGARWLPLLVMPFACILLVGGLAQPNPLSLSFADAARFDAERPGIVAISRHPVIWAIGLWAASHMVPNGDAAALMMFSLLLLSGLMGPISLDAKRRARLGEEHWQRLAARTSNVPLLAVFSGKSPPRGLGIVPLAGGLGLYVMLIFLHEWVIGVSPLP